MKWLVFILLSVGVCQADITNVESINSTMLIVHGSGFGNAKAFVNDKSMRIAHRTGSSITLICKGAYAPPCKGHVIQNGEYTVRLTNGDTKTVWISNLGPANGSGGS